MIYRGEEKDALEIYAFGELFISMLTLNLVIFDCKYTRRSLATWVPT